MVADRHAEKAAEFGSAFTVKPVDVDTLINDQSIDGIVIATAAPSHDALAIAALAAGKHVYVEKPLSLSPFYLLISIDHNSLVFF